MKAEYLKPVILATQDVFQNMLQQLVQEGEIRLNADSVATQGVNISIGVTGDLRGVIVYSFSEEMVLSIVAGMSGMMMDKIDKFVTSAIGELANIISGQAMTHFTEGDYRCEIVPPQIFMGENMTLAMAHEEILTVELQSGMETFAIHMALESQK